MREIGAWIAGCMAIVVLAFNPQLVTSAWNLAYSPIKAYSDNKEDVLGANELLQKAPRIPTKNQGVPASPEYMRSDEPTPTSSKGKAGADYGAGAVAIQRARGL